MPAPNTPALISTNPSTAIVWCNLGSPDAPTRKAVRRFLADFLSDPRVIELPRWLWWPILYGPVLLTRPEKSARKYAHIWTPEGSPMHVHSNKQAELLQNWFRQRGHNVQVIAAMRYGKQAIDKTLSELQKQGIQRILLLPAYPQYSCTTTASIFDAVFSWSMSTRDLPEWRFVKSYHQHPLYISALAQNIRQHWEKHGRSDMLVMSFHGVPERICHLGDPYSAECRISAELLAQELGLEAGQYLVTFQSRFGAAKWLQPYTEDTLRQLPQQGINSVDIICPGFVCDCLETLEEIKLQAQEVFITAGGHAFRYIECLNDKPDWIDALGHISLQHIAGWETDSTNHIETDANPL